MSVDTPQPHASADETPDPRTYDGAQEIMRRAAEELWTQYPGFACQGIVVRPEAIILAFAKPEDVPDAVPSTLAGMPVRVEVRGSGHLA